MNLTQFLYIRNFCYISTDMSTRQIRTIAIVAMNPQRIIGGPEGELPWPRISEDFKHFKSQTTGHPVIVGRTTFDEIVERLGKPLPRRFCSVVSRSRPNEFPESQVAISGNPNDALLRARDRALDKVFVIGGATIYDTLLGLVDEILVTRIFIELPDGPRFPQFEDIFERVGVEEQTEEHELRYQFEHWVRPS